MSLIPYTSREGREVVLRHKNAVVIRDPGSNELTLRGEASPVPLPAAASECPYCHQTLRPRSPERESRPSQSRESFVNPDYFRMLQLTSEPLVTVLSPPSPIRRLTQPAIGVGEGHNLKTEEAETSIRTSALPEMTSSQSIEKDSFSPGYFKRFFREEGELGRGGKGVVLLVRHQLDGVDLGNFACKRVPVGDDHAWLEKVLIEVQLLQGLSHPNLVSYRHVWLEDAQISRFGPPVACAFILQQYCNAGDLLHYVIGREAGGDVTKEQLKENMRRRSRGSSDHPIGLRTSQRRLSFDDIYSFFKDITSGLAHLHASNYIHRDLKPSNCLLHQNGHELRCLISDFGEVQAENVVRKSTGATGTISYCAPEVLRRDATGRYGEFSTKSDVFSLGMILYFMCFGRLPYSGTEAIQEEFEDLDQLRAEISAWSGFREERQERPDLPDQLYDFLKRLLALDPLERPSAVEILNAIKLGTGLELPSRSERYSSTIPLVAKSRRTQVPDSVLSVTLDHTRGMNSVDATGTTNVAEKTLSGRVWQETIPTTGVPPGTLIDEPRTPLLLPATQTQLPTFRDRLMSLTHFLAQWIRARQVVVGFVVRLSIFIIKLSTLMEACLPATMARVYLYPLLLLAALDLGSGRLSTWRSTGGLAITHFLVVQLATQIDLLCTPSYHSGRVSASHFDVSIVPTDCDR